MSKIGKDQTYAREVNTLAIIDSLTKNDLSGTDLKELLSLSSATISSILKELEGTKLIKVSEASSIYGKGRKRVVYSINDEYGLILCVNISNYHARISLSNLKCNIIKSIDIQIKKYDSSSVYQIILEASKLILSLENKQPLLNIVISVPGRVNSETNELLLSNQFEEDIIVDNFIPKMFKKQFGEKVPVYLVNDINLFAVGEILQGQLKNVNNAIFLSVDYGIGGSLILQKKIFEGDKGYAGEFGLITYCDNGVYAPIDEFISLRVLINKASKILGKEITRDELIELYSQNKEIKEMVLHSGCILGKALREIIDVLDISTIVLGGRISLFGNEYLAAIKSSFETSVTVPNISFSTLKDDGEILGAATFGANKFFKRSVRGRNEK